jgi:nucleotide-binding universal stress UspA family protein
MPEDRQPVLVAYDGSAESQAAVEAAAELFPDRRLVVVSVWEPGLAMAMLSTTDITGAGYVVPTAEQMARVDGAQRDRAAGAAESGAQIARDRGVTAEALPVEDETDVVDTIAAIARRLDASAVVVGTRGLGAFKAGLFGSTSRGLLRRLERPVVVV